MSFRPAGSEGFRPAGGLLGLAGAALIALAGCAVPEGPAAPSTRAPAEAVLARLPAQAAGFDRFGVQDVAPEDPGAGKVVEYATARRVAVAQVFLYDLGRPAVEPADLGPEAERAVSEATALPFDRTGRQLAVASRSPLAVPGGDLSCALLTGTFGRNQVERQVCVGVVAGRFLRVQVTMPRRGAPVADARAFTQEVAAAARRG
ncbi:hypothetical protein [Muricoccus nepalensis]|nr:hypothetical protein [Roseomonas nepalensis]